MKTVTFSDEEINALSAGLLAQWSAMVTTGEIDGDVDVKRIIISILNKLK